MRASTMTHFKYLVASILAAMSILLLSSCSTGVDSTQYANEKPALDLKQYFNGTLDAWGMFQDRSGRR